MWRWRRCSGDSTSTQFATPFASSRLSIIVSGPRKRSHNAYTMRRSYNVVTNTAMLLFSGKLLSWHDIRWPLENDDPIEDSIWAIAIHCKMFCKKK